MNGTELYFPSFRWLAVAVFLYLCYWLLKHKGAQLQWPALAAVMMALLLAVWPLSWRWQLALFTLLSLFTWLVGRQIYAPIRLRIASYPMRRFPIGKVLPLLDAPQQGRARIRIGNTLWRVRLRDSKQELLKGALVKVVGRRDRILIVEPVNHGEHSNINQEHSSSIS